MTLTDGLALKQAFELLSFLYLYPEDRLLEYLEEEGLEQLERLSDSLEVRESVVLNDLRKRLGGGATERAGLLLDLQIEYTRLFINAFPKMVAPPYSSVYLHGKGKVWGESTSRMTRLYSAAGLEIVEGFNDIPDHIAAELACASYLQLLIGQGESKGRELYRELVEEHLSLWVPEFLGRVIEDGKSTFYSHVAGVTLKLIEAESAELSASSLS